MDIELPRTFIAIVENGSFVRGARATIGGLNALVGEDRRISQSFGPKRCNAPRCATVKPANSIPRPQTNPANPTAYEILRCPLR